MCFQCLKEIEALWYIAYYGKPLFTIVNYLLHHGGCLVGIKFQLKLISTSNTI